MTSRLMKPVYDPAATTHLILPVRPLTQPFPFVLFVCKQHPRMLISPPATQDIQAGRKL